MAGSPTPRPLARWLFLVAGCASLLAWAAAERLAPPEAVPWTAEMRAAAERMAGAGAAIRRWREDAGIPPDPTIDPNGTGLVGPEYDELFTTLGDLEAKRTATNPDAAALLAHLLARAGVERGDTVAVGASGSFPALLVAALTATEALGAYPQAILSLGASSFGATDAGFDLLSLHQVLLEGGVVRTPPAAVSLGGRGDAGADFEPEVRARLEERLRVSGVPFVPAGSLPGSVTRRMELYGWGPPSDASCRPSAFVNVGGADANIGTSPTLLGLRPGLLEPGEIPMPPLPQRGVLHQMAAAGVPVIHLLDMRALAARYGLPWDPAPLPSPGSTRLTRGDGAPSRALATIAGVWLAAMVILGVAGVRLARRSRETPTLP